MICVLPTRIAPPLLTAALLAAATAPTPGCARQRAALHSEPPTYSYMHDDAALAELDLWPTAASGLTMAGVEADP